MPETFTSAASGLKQNEFLAPGNLLSLRNGRQIEPASFVDDLLDNESEECWETATIDTSIPTQIANSGHSRLKRQFLDCLSEFAPTRKTARLWHVPLLWRPKTMWFCGLSEMEDLPRKMTWYFVA